MNPSSENLLQRSTSSLHELIDASEPVVGNFIKAITPRVKTAYENSRTLRWVLTAILLAWGIIFSKQYRDADDEKRDRLIFYDRLWMGYKHPGMLTHLFKLWVYTVLLYVLLGIK